ncbi:unnamed protein product [Sphagnum jensenii]|uniref:Uncharacterized protein n=1 Tax=Sphagnum jensenii TaxID=128206 RepID=A0ABP1AQC6_9BRYO
MCYAVGCKQCGKTTWAGCGRHVPGVYKSIPQDKVCLCKDWPGVSLPKQTSEEKNPTDVVVGQAGESASGAEKSATQLHETECAAAVTPASKVGGSAAGQNSANQLNWSSFLKSVIWRRSGES